jgi:hypothetical protein
VKLREAAIAPFYIIAPTTIVGKTNLSYKVRLIEEESEKK